MGKVHGLWLIRRALQGMGLGLSAGIIICVLSYFGTFGALERMAVDSMLRVSARPGLADKDIVLVALDQGSLDYVSRTLHMQYPWPRGLYGELVRFIRRGDPKAIVFDMLFIGPDINRDEMSGDDSDKMFSDSISKSDDLVLGVSLRMAGSSSADGMSAELMKKIKCSGYENMDLNTYTQVDPLAQPLVESSARFGFVNALVDPDGIVRRVQLLARLAPGKEVVPGLTLAAYDMIHGRHLNNHRDCPELPPEVKKKVNNSGSAWINFHGPGGPGQGGAGLTYTYFPMANLLRSEVQIQMNEKPGLDPGIFHDKWVIIGSTSTALFDQKATAFSTDGNFPGMEIHAAVLDNLLHGDFLWQAPRWTVWLLVLVVSLIVAIFGRFIGRVHWNIVVVAVLSVAFFLLSGLLFVSKGMILDPITLQSSLLTSFLAVTFVNLSQERRGRKRIKKLFQHYLDPRVIHGLLQQPDNIKLGGERRVCTVFFSDIAGFTSFAEGMDPQELVELMNQFLSEMTDAIIKNGGFVDKYIGDAVMAVFGAPVDMPHHAEAACRAALECHRRIRLLSEEFRKQGRPGINIRIGLNTGEMIVGNMGSMQRMNYTVMGDAVNLASRLEGACKQFGTNSLVGPRTARQVGKAMVLRRIDLIRVKGKQEPVWIFELVGQHLGIKKDIFVKLELFEKALEEYRKRNWSVALKNFAGLLSKWPDDGPSRTYVKRCKEFIESPPGDDWDGVYTMTSK